MEKIEKNIIKGIKGDIEQEEKPFNRHLARISSGFVVIIYALSPF